MTIRNDARKQDCAIGELRHLGIAHLGSARLPRSDVVEHRFHVGRKRRCIAQLNPVSGAGVCFWSPDVPKAMNAVEWTDYRVGRETLMAQVADKLGAGVMSVDPGRTCTTVVVHAPNSGGVQ